MVRMLWSSDRGWEHIMWHLQESDTGKLYHLCGGDGNMTHSFEWVRGLHLAEAVGLPVAFIKIMNFRFQKGGDLVTDSFQSRQYFQNDRSNPFVKL